MLIVAGLAVFWFAPFGTGESRPSPDTRFTAHASNFSQRTLWGDKQHYIELRVVEESSQREIWRVIRQHSADANVPDYGTRGIQFVAWAPDSKSVTIPVMSGRELVLDVP